MTMRKEVADFRANFSIAGLDVIRRDFAETARVLKGMDSATSASSANSTRAAADAARAAAAMRVQEAQNLAAAGKWRADLARVNQRKARGALDNADMSEAMARSDELQAATAARRAAVQTRLQDRAELRAEKAAAREMVAVAEAAEREQEALQRKLTAVTKEQIDVRVMAEAKAAKKRLPAGGKAAIAGVQSARADMQTARSASSGARVDYRLAVEDYTRDGSDEALAAAHAARDQRVAAAQASLAARARLRDARAAATAKGVLDQADAPAREAAAARAQAVVDARINREREASERAAAQAAADEARAARAAAQAEERRAEEIQLRAAAVARAAATDGVYATAEARRRADARTDLAALRKPWREVRAMSRDQDLGPDGMAEYEAKRRALVEQRLAARARVRAAVAAARVAGVEDDMPGDRDTRLARYRNADLTRGSRSALLDARAKARQQKAELLATQAWAAGPEGQAETAQDREAELRQAARDRRQAVMRALDYRKRVRDAYAAARAATAAVEGEAMLQVRAERAAAAERIALEKTVTRAVVAEVAVRAKAQPSRVGEDPAVTVARQRLALARADAAGARRVVKGLNPDDERDEALRGQALASRRQAVEAALARRAELRAEQGIGSEARAEEQARRAAALRLDEERVRKVSEDRMTEEARIQAAIRTRLDEQEAAAAIHAAEQETLRREALERALTRVSMEEAEIRAAAARAPAIRKPTDAKGVREAAILSARENARILREAEDEARSHIGDTRASASAREARAKQAADDAAALAAAAKTRQDAAQKAYNKPVASEAQARARMDALESAKAERTIALERAKAATAAYRNELANGKASVAAAEVAAAERVRLAREEIAEREALEKKMTRIAEREADLRRQATEAAARKAAQAEERAAREAIAAKREADRQADREERAADRKRAATQRAADKAERTKRAQERETERAAEKAERQAAAAEAARLRAEEKAARLVDRAARDAARAAERAADKAERLAAAKTSAERRAIEKAARESDRAARDAARAAERAADKADRQAASAAAAQRRADDKAAATLAKAERDAERKAERDADKADRQADRDRRAADRAADKQDRDARRQKLDDVRATEKAARATAAAEKQAAKEAAAVAKEREKTVASRRALAVGLVTGTGRGIGAAASGVATITSTATKASLAVASIGASAFAAASKLTLHLGGAAVSMLARVGTTAARSAASVARIGTGTALKGGALGAAAAGGATAFTVKAVSDASERSAQIVNASRSSGLDLDTYQSLVGAAKKYNIEVDDIRGSLIQFQGQLKAVATSPDSDLGKYFSRLGISATDAAGNVKSTQAALLEVIQSANRLGSSERVAFLSQMFGEDDAAKLIPLFEALAADTDLLAKSKERMQRSGTFLDERDIGALDNARRGVSDFKDSWTGFMNSVAGGSSAQIATTFRILAELVNDYRGIVANAFGRGSDTLLSYTADLYVLVKGGWDGVYDSVGDVATQTAKVQAAAKAAGVEMQSIVIQPNIKHRWLIDVRNGLTWIGYLARKAWPSVKTLFAAMSGDKIANVQMPWVKHLQTGLFAAGRLAREVILTIGGDDALVTEFPWLIKLRTAIGAVGRFAGEVFYAAVNDRQQVTEFPWLLKIRDSIAAVIPQAQRLAFELKAALTGNDQDVGSYQFAWIPAAKEKVITFVHDVRRVWADLGAVWAGDREAMTGPGQAFAGMMKSLDDLKAYIGNWQIWFQQVGADVALVWSQIGAPAKDAQAALDGLNFGNAKGLADSFLFVANAAKEGWGWFRAVYDQMFAIVGLSGINLESALFFLAFLKLTGTLGGLSMALGVVMKPLKWIAAFLGLGGAVSAGAGGAATAVGGLTAALGGLLTKLQAVGALAATPWGMAILGGVAGGVGVYKLAQNDGPLSFLKDWTGKLADWVNDTDGKLKEVEGQFARNAEVGGASPLGNQLARERAQAAVEWERTLAAERGRPDILAQAYVAPPPSPIRTEPPAYDGPRSQIPPVPVVFELKSADGETARVPGYMDQDALARARAASNRFGT